MAYVIDQKNCSGCHRCRMECPVDAIRFKNDKYWIDPEKCVSCGTCRTVCHNGCISDPDAPPAEVTPHDPIRLECDVCVIGAGAAGMVAAARAQDAGAKVIVLEKNHEIGGSAYFATGFSVHYSKWHKAAGRPDGRAQKYQEFLQKTAGYDIDRELLQRLFDANGDWIDWLIDQHHFEDLYEYNPNAFGPMCLRKKVAPPWNDRRIDGMIGPGGGGWLIPAALLQDFTAHGGTVLCSTPARHLKLDDTGAITGVIAEDAGGIVEVTCKAVVVASGAFTRNKEIMDKMQPLFYQDEGNQPVHIFTCATCTGDGITMCEEIGADVDYKNRRVNMFGPMRHPYPGVTLNSGNGPMFRTDGQRFMMDFKMTEVSDLVNVPHRYIWKIVDDATFQRNIQHKIDQGPDEHGVDLSHFLKNWRQVVREEAEAGAVVIADSVTELGSKLDFDPVKFAYDINAYNQGLLAPKAPPMMPPMGDPGEGPEGMPGGPGKKPEGPGGDGPDLEMLMKMMGPPAQPLTTGPFYAIKMTMFHENSVGGMTIDKNASVLKQGIPVPGLFAAGDTTRGVMIPGDIGVEYIEGVFTALTYAFNSGFIAGTEAAKYLEY